MSEYPLPATVTERRDAGRHGRPPGRGKGRPLGVRASHLYLALLPAAIMALLGLAAVVDLLAVGTSSPMGRLGLVLVAAAAVVVLGAAILGADVATRLERRLHGHQPAAPGSEDVQRWLGELAFLVSRGRQELQALRDRITAGETPPPRGADSRPAPADDPFAQLAHELWKSQNEAWNSIISAASLRGNGGNGGSAQRVEVFVNLARRMQTLSHRAIQGLDELENQVEDPDLLKGLFKVDHLSTRMRRQAESLAVIGGAASRRQWSRPVTVYEVLRSAIAEVEHYNRVKVAPPVEGTLDGSAVADVIHLLAELIENATKFAPPHTRVIVRAEQVTAGLAIEVEDRGLGIPRESQRRLNDLLADLERINVEELVQDGRIGLLVVSALSRRHKIAVKLNTNLYGGTEAVVVIPKELVGSEEQETNAPRETPPEPAETVAALPSGTPGDTPGGTPSGTPGDTPDGFSASMPLSGSGQGTIRSTQPNDHNVAVAHLGDPPGGTAWSDQNAGTSAEQADGRIGPQPPGGGQRPELPRRHAQANLAPELLDAPPPPDDDADTGHNPGLMAAFQKGMRSGQEEEDPTDRTGGTG
jgi:signal transduction histidine kinase